MVTWFEFTCSVDNDTMKRGNASLRSSVFLSLHAGFRGVCGVLSSLFHGFSARLLIKRFALEGTTAKYSRKHALPSLPCFSVRCCPLNIDLVSQHPNDPFDVFACIRRSPRGDTTWRDPTSLLTDTRQVDQALITYIVSVDGKPTFTDNDVIGCFFRLLADNVKLFDIVFAPERRLSTHEQRGVDAEYRWLMSEATQVHFLGTIPQYDNYILHRATSNYLYYKVSTVSGGCKPV